MEKRQFRSDLYYRLNQVKFEIPPLRQRPLDIVPLAVDFIDAPPLPACLWMLTGEA